MILIIDGTNALHHLGWVGPRHEDAAARFADAARSAAALRGSEAVVCFDGVEPLGAPVSSGAVRTSGAREADELILDAAKEARAQNRPTTVVSGDRSLQARAHALGCDCPNLAEWLSELGLGVDTTGARSIGHEAESSSGNPAPTSLADRLDAGTAAKLERIRRNLDT